ncbi:MAG: hypothetical protein DBX55_10065 [Verrucomicrobia bacterium]|nr:MAG: hypothetical protein DBX55_10065 [Verrucomicrobiota bacterium]
MKLVNLTSRLNAQESFIDAVALFDVLLIALMLTLSGSRFAAAPGISIDLPELAGEPLGGELALTDADLAVLNAKSDTMLIYNGTIYTPQAFEKRMLADKKGKSEDSRGTLLVKADKSVSSQTLLRICRLAKEGGYSRVHIAARESKSNEENN